MCVCQTNKHELASGSAAAPAPFPGDSISIGQHERSKGSGNLSNSKFFNYNTFRQKNLDLR